MCDLRAFVALGSAVHSTSRSWHNITMEAIVAYSGRCAHCRRACSCHARTMVVHHKGELVGKRENTYRCSPSLIDSRKNKRWKCASSASGLSRPGWLPSRKHDWRRLTSNGQGSEHDVCPVYRLWHPWSWGVYLS